jgi:hypothetical protein
VPSPEASDELSALTDAFFDRVGFVGLGSMEYKRDTRDNRFYMVEPTVGRTDYQEEIAALNGVNIPLTAYIGELGLPLPSAESVVRPRAWRDSVASQKSGSAGAPDSLARICPGAKIVDVYFRRNDPLPFVLMKLEPVMRRLRRLSGGH